jgi:hypothetical protein
VKIGNRQKFGFPLRQPPGARGGLALGAVTIPARVIKDDAMSTPITLLNAPAERGRAALANMAQGFALLTR